jgi:hypothetical protein
MFRLPSPTLPILHHPSQDAVDSRLVSGAFRLEPIHHLPIHSQRNPLLSRTVPARLRPRLLALIQRYGAIGVDVRMMEQQMTYGYVPADVIVKLRAFANRVSDDGTLKN